MGIFPETDCPAALAPDTRAMSRRRLLEAAASGVLLATGGRLVQVMAARETASASAARPATAAPDPHRGPPVRLAERPLTWPALRVAERGGRFYAVAAEPALCLEVDRLSAELLALADATRTSQQLAAELAGDFVLGSEPVRLIEQRVAQLAAAGLLWTEGVIVPVAARG